MTKLTLGGCGGSCGFVGGGACDGNCGSCGFMGGGCGCDC